MRDEVHVTLGLEQPLQDLVNAIYLDLVARPLSTADKAALANVSQGLRDTLAGLNTLVSEISSINTKPPQKEEK